MFQSSFVFLLYQCRFVRPCSSCDTANRIFVTFVVYQLICFMAIGLLKIFSFPEKPKCRIFLCLCAVNSRCWRYYVFELPVCMSVYPYIQYVHPTHSCERNISGTPGGNCITFTNVSHTWGWRISRDHKTMTDLLIIFSWEKNMISKNRTALKIEQLFLVFLFVRLWVGNFRNNYYS